MDLANVADTVSGAPSTPAEEADRDLIGRVAVQDRQAFEKLYHRYAPRLGGYLWKLLRNQELVDEALNDVMLVLWQKAETFDFRARLSTWLFGIAHNKGLKALARSHRHPSSMSPYPPNEDHPDALGELRDPDNPEQSLLRGDLINALTEALATLSPEQRAVVELTCYEGRSYAEVAEIVGCPVNTVKTRMFHARKRLTQCLARKGLDPSLSRLVEAD